MLQGRAALTEFHMLRLVSTIREHLKACVLTQISQLPHASRLASLLTDSDLRALLVLLADSDDEVEDSSRVAPKIQALVKACRIFLTNLAKTYHSLSYHETSLWKLLFRLIPALLLGYQR